MTNLDNDVDVIIIGGGIGGLSAAYALTRKGYLVRVHEQAAEFGEVGAGLQLAPNCTRILDDLGLLDEILALGVLPESMVMKDATDGSELTRLDLTDLRREYEYPYVVIHRSDLHRTLLEACRRAGVELLTDRRCVGVTAGELEGSAHFTDGTTDTAPLVIAADGLHSRARAQLVGDETVSSSYVAYRGTVPFESVADHDVSDSDVVVYVGPGCHFVQYPLRGGDMFNQVAVFESEKARRGEADWGTPDELDAAFEGTCDAVQEGLPLMWRDRWWRMYDRDPIDSWVFGRVVLLGDAAHPPLQYMAQGAIMAIEDGWVLAEHAAAHRTDGVTDWDAVTAAYDAVRPEHCRRVVLTSRAWGILWHLDGDKRDRRNEILRARGTTDYSYTDWIYGPTALEPDQEPSMYEVIPLDAAAAAVAGG
jgi:3-hydroxybenzoate 6-monooxygenase